MILAAFADEHFTRSVSSIVRQPEHIQIVRPGGAHIKPEVLVGGKGKVPTWLETGLFVRAGGLQKIPAALPGSLVPVIYPCIEQSGNTFGQGV